jgi:hypothetical protein
VTARRPRALLAIVALAFTVSGCSLTSGGTPADSRAAQICTSFLPTSVTTTPGAFPGAELFSESWTTAGQVTTLAKQMLGHPLHPWDELARNHFVAQCGFPYTTGTTSTTMKCPGDALPPDLEASQQFYVDEQGRSTPAIPPISIPEDNFCAYGAVSPASS